jgi:hypothetical protein
MFLAVDIGATSVKFASVGADGEFTSEVGQIPTPYPCEPTSMVELVADIISGFSEMSVGVGFPGDFADGTVIQPGNLSREAGFDSPIDPIIHAKWEGFGLQNALREATGRNVRVVNDAAMAAIGYSDGQGRELTLTLGTGLGIALVVEGQLTRIRDVGSEEFKDYGTYDEVLGEFARAQDSQVWRDHLHEAVRAFVDEFKVTKVHFGGGNARRLPKDEFAELGIPVVFNDNNGTLKSVLKLFADESVNR